MSKPVDQGLHNDLSAIMNENVNEIHKAFPEGSFSVIFFEISSWNITRKDMHINTRHPLMIKSEAYV